MSTINDGGPAFPVPMMVAPNGNMTSGADGYGLGGMSLRDYFAAKAMAAMASNEYQYSHRTLDRNEEDHDGTDSCTSCLPQHAIDDIPFAAYELADAMLRVRVREAK